MTKASDVFFEVHRALAQEGPGNDASTLTALSHVTGLSESSKILDIGCGPGRQTLALARATLASIVAVDHHQPFLDQLTASARTEGLTHRMTLMNNSMAELRVDKNFDLIWCEAAAYIMGVPEALRSWKEFLEPGGHLILSECTWLTDQPSQEIKKFFDQGYPAMTTVKGNLALMQSEGYRVVEHFPLPSEAWWQYYEPIKAKLPDLRRKYASDAEALGVIEAEEQEIGFYERFGNEYGYVFFVLES